MNRWTAGIVAGFLASVVLGILMLLKGMMGLAPGFSAIAGNAAVFAKIGTPATPTWGWIWHFLIGSIAWGLLYAAIRDRLPGASEPVRGLVFGLIAWLAMMIAWMPLAGMGLFAMPDPGMMALVMTLVLHLIYGLVLGAAYARVAPAGGATEPAAEA
ncbi:MAG: DUF6789 family protein [Rhodothalassiaceae bacterium]